MNIQVAIYYLFTILKRYTVYRLNILGVKFCEFMASSFFVEDFMDYKTSSHIARKNCNASQSSWVF